MIPPKCSHFSSSGLRRSKKGGHLAAFFLGYFPGKYFSMVSLLGGLVPSETKSIRRALPTTIGKTGRKPFTVTLTGPRRKIGFPSMTSKGGGGLRGPAGLPPGAPWGGGLRRNFRGRLEDLLGLGIGH